MMNKCFIIGNLTRTPELRTTPNGVSVCTFGIAVNRRFKDQSGQQGTDFFNVVVWRQQGENCAKCLDRGSKAAVFGHLETRSYEDKQGVKRTVTEIIADEVEFLSGKREQQQEQAQQGLEDYDGDTPF